MGPLRVYEVASWRVGGGVTRHGSKGRQGWRWMRLCKTTLKRLGTHFVSSLDIIVVFNLGHSSCTNSLSSAVLLALERVNECGYR